MCGVAAIFAYGANAPAADGKELAAMGEAMRARGPDGEGLWLAGDGRAGLAHRRLAIIDLSAAAAQPMQLDGGRYRISYNGEIYNFPVLRRQLEDKGHHFTTNSDTEVLLRLYQAEGAGMVRRLRGMYAFALWDEERRGLLLARDPFGVKPLYYADDGSTLRAASQVKALTAGGVWTASSTCRAFSPRRTPPPPAICATPSRTASAIISSPTFRSAYSSPRDWIRRPSPRLPRKRAAAASRP